MASWYGTVGPPGNIISGYSTWGWGLCIGSHSNKVIASFSNMASWSGTVIWHRRSSQCQISGRRMQRMMMRNMYRRITFQSGHCFVFCYNILIWHPDMASWNGIVGTPKAKFQGMGYREWWWRTHIGFLFNTAIATFSNMASWYGILKWYRWFSQCHNFRTQNTENDDEYVE